MLTSHMLAWMPTLTKQEQAAGNLYISPQDSGNCLIINGLQCDWLTDENQHRDWCQEKFCQEVHRINVGCSEQIQGRAHHVSGGGYHWWRHYQVRWQSFLGEFSVNVTLEKTHRNGFNQIPVGHRQKQTSAKCKKKNREYTDPFGAGKITKTKCVVVPREACFINLIVREKIKEIVSVAIYGQMRPTWYFIRTQMSRPVIGYLCFGNQQVAVYSHLGMNTIIIIPGEICLLPLCKQVHFRLGEFI